MRHSFVHYLQRLHQNGQYRTFEALRRVVGSAPIAQHGKQGTVVSWCSNDYLNLSQHAAVIAAAVDATERYGVGSGGTRNIGGTSESIVQLESELAAFHQQPSALLFNSAYAANTGTLTALAKIVPNLCFVSDADNHASMVEGMRTSRSKVHVFAHNDLAHLSSILETLHQPVCIATESVFSMDGSVAPLRELRDLAARHQALLYVDEVHAVGLYGLEGRGLCADQQVVPDLLIGGCGKAFGTQGGYMVGSSDVVDCVRSSASSFIFTTSPSTTIVEATRASLTAVRWNGDALRQRFFDVVARLKAALESHGVPILTNQSHIVAVPVGCAHRCAAVSKRLLAMGHYAQPIFYPTVPKYHARLRLTPTPHHTPAMVSELAHALATALAHVPDSKDRLPFHPDMRPTNGSLPKSFHVRLRP